MSVSFKVATALGFILAIPLFAVPALGAPAHQSGYRPAHRRVEDFAAATALVKPAAPVAEEHKTDGLSRKDEDCSRGGCIDR
jgi:hypothetical protein